MCWLLDKKEEAIHVEYGLVVFFAASAVPAKARVRAGRCMVAKRYYEQGRIITNKSRTLERRIETPANTLFGAVLLSLFIRNALRPYSSPIFSPCPPLLQLLQSKSMFMQPRSVSASPPCGPGRYLKNFRERRFAHHRRNRQGLAMVCDLAAEKLVIGDVVPEAAKMLNSSCNLEELQV
jgi:hypothetical protein